MRKSKPDFKTALDALNDLTKRRREEEYSDSGEFQEYVSSEIEDKMAKDVEQVEKELQSEKWCFSIMWCSEIEEYVIRADEINQF